MAQAEKLNDLQLLSRTIKRLERMGEHTIEGQLIALAREIEYYRKQIKWYKDISGIKSVQTVAVKVKKKTNPALLVKAPPLPVGYEPDPNRRERRQP